MPIIPFQEFDSKADDDLAKFLGKKGRNPWSSVKLDVNAPDTAAAPCEPFHLIGGNLVGTDRWVGALRVPPSGKVYCINPRVGWPRFYAMLENAYSIILGRSEGATGGSNHQAADLMAIAWYSALKRGLKHHHGWPKGYVRRDEPDATVLRGQIDLGRQLTENLGHQHRIACIYDELTFDHPVNHATQFVIEHLSRQRLFPFKEKGAGSCRVPRSALLKFRESLNLVGVEVPERFPMIAPRWNRMTGGYRASFELGRCLAQGKGLSNGRLATDDAIFVDTAEVWEMFLFERLKRCVRELPGKYEVVSPRYYQRNKDCLLEHEGRRRGHLIPDYLLRCVTSQQVVAVLDAKYRHLDNDRGIYMPKDEEVVQMALYSMTVGCQPVPAMLVYPVASAERDAKGINSYLAGPNKGVVIGDAKLRISGEPKLLWSAINLEINDENNKDTYTKPGWRKEWLESIDKQLVTMLTSLLRVVRQ